MEQIARVLSDGPVLLLSGIFLVIVGGAGLLSTGGASHSRMRTTKPIGFVIMLVVGVLLGSAGLTVLLTG